MRQEMKKRESERGEAGAKLIIVLVILFLLGNAGYNFVPVAYEAENFKQEMQTAVVQGMAMPPVGVTPTDHVKNKIWKAARENHVPSDAVVHIIMNKGVMQAQVTYTKKVPLLPFGLYEYEYVFDHTAMPTGFLMKS